MQTLRLLIVSIEGGVNTRTPFVGVSVLFQRNFCFNLQSVTVVI